MIAVGGLALVLGAGAVLAQTPPPTPPPAQPPAGQPPAQQPPAQPATPQPDPPKPFPEGAKVAYIDLQMIVANSVEGKAGTAKLQEFEKKRMAELTEKNKSLEAMRTKLQQGAGVMSEQAQRELEKSIEKMTRDLQLAQQDAQSERDDMQNDLQQEFLRKLSPIIQQVAEEKGLHMVFEIRNTAAIYVNTGLNLSAEVIKRFDARTQAGAKK
jgi:Skp family chaperone for outer membrane proteins